MWVEQIYLAIKLPSNIKAVEWYTFDEGYMNDKVGVLPHGRIERLADNSIARSIPHGKPVKKLWTRIEKSVPTSSSATRLLPPSLKATSIFL